MALSCPATRPDRKIYGGSVDTRPITFAETMGKWSARYTAHNHCWSNLSGSARYAADKLSSSTWTCEHLLLDTGPLPKQLQDILNTWAELVLQHDQSRMAAYPAQDNAIRVDLFERLTFRLVSLKSFRITSRSVFGM